MVDAMAHADDQRTRDDRPRQLTQGDDPARRGREMQSIARARIFLFGSWDGLNSANGA